MQLMKIEKKLVPMSKKCFPGPQLKVHSEVVVLVILGRMSFKKDIHVHRGYRVVQI
jgi:hypothetical protein